MFPKTIQLNATIDKTSSGLMLLIPQQKILIDQPVTSNTATLLDVVKQYAHDENLPCELTHNQFSSALRTKPGNGRQRAAAFFNENYRNGEISVNIHNEILYPKEGEKHLLKSTQATAIEQWNWDEVKKLDYEPDLERPRIKKDKTTTFYTASDVADHFTKFISGSMANNISSSNGISKETIGNYFLNQISTTIDNGKGNLYLPNTTDRKWWENELSMEEIRRKAYMKGEEDSFDCWQELHYVWLGFDGAEDPNRKLIDVHQILLDAQEQGLCLICDQDARWGKNFQRLKFNDPDRLALFLGEITENLRDFLETAR